MNNNNEKSLVLVSDPQHKVQIKNPQKTPKIQDKHHHPYVPIQYWEGFDAIPGDEIETQMRPEAVQPHKLYFNKP